MININVFAAGLLITALIAIGALRQDREPCCSVIDINKDSGIVLVRDFTKSWITAFRPNALELAGLRVGDTVDVSLEIQQVSRVKGQPRSYKLTQPRYADPCCEVLRILPGSSQYTITAAKTGGDSIQFKLPDSLAAALMIGNNVYTSPTHGYAMIRALLHQDTVFYGFPLMPKIVEDSGTVKREKPKAKL